MMLDEGWNLIPVICGDDVMCSELFTALGGDLVVAKEIAGTEVYWPSEGVTTLEQLNSGQAYMVKMDAGGSITFPEADNSTDVGKPENKTLKSRFIEECLPTGNSHLISIPSEVIASSAEPFVEGDIIYGFYDDPEITFGSVELTDLSENHTLVLFGNDTTTTEQDGLNVGEEFYLTLYRPSLDQMFPLLVLYDETFPDQEEYSNEGLSKIDVIEIWTGIEDNAASKISVYPNPAKDQIAISGIENVTCNIEMLDIKGQVVLNIKNSESNTIDVSMLEQGVYFVKISGEEISVVRKLVVK
jgi:hypothetical protein